tara:strand:- start:99 stop:1061 length:963 start_codon:yes stop_codon:yes gene_type:complete
MPYKDFQINEILTAADVNDYLMDQSVMTFADEAARTAALAAPTAGMLTFLVDVAAINVYDGSAWVEISGGGGGGVTISATAPTDPAPESGNLWWDSVNGELYVYYVDVDSSQWVAAAGPSVTVASVAPTGYEGQLWLDDTDGSMYVYYTDPGGGASSWIGAVSRSGGILQVVSATKTDTFTTSSTSFTDVTGYSATITPSSTSSKILVIANYSISNSSNTTTSAAISRMMRDSTPIFVGDSAGLRIGASGFHGNDANYRMLDHVTNTYLDSPSTTSSTTYKIQLRVGTGGVAGFNRTGEDYDGNGVARLAAGITLMEVAG